VLAFFIDMNIEECFKVGYISRTHGLKGEVTAVFDDEFELGDLTSVFLEFNGSLVPYFLESISDRGDQAFVKFEGVDSLTEANNLKGCSVYLPKSVRPKSKRGEFYDDEIIGFVVDDENHGNLGSVKEIQDQGMNRILVIEGKKEILVPFDSPLVVSVNKTKKIIKVNLPEGFLEF